VAKMLLACWRRCVAVLTVSCVRGAGAQLVAIILVIGLAVPVGALSNVV